VAEGAQHGQLGEEVNPAVAEGHAHKPPA
jgi:hypothetical protein